MFGSNPYAGNDRYQLFCLGLYPPQVMFLPVDALLLVTLAIVVLVAPVAVADENVFFAGDQHGAVLLSQ